MLKKEYDKRKKAAKDAALISKACEGADDVTIRQGIDSFVIPTAPAEIPLKYFLSAATLVVLLLLVVF